MRRAHNLRRRTRSACYGEYSRLVTMLGYDTGCSIHCTLCWRKRCKTVKLTVWLQKRVPIGPLRRIWTDLAVVCYHLRQDCARSLRDASRLVCGAGDCAGNMAIPAPGLVRCSEYDGRTSRPSAWVCLECRCVHPPLLPTAISSPSSRHARQRPCSENQCQGPSGGPPGLSPPPHRRAESSRPTPSRLKRSRSVLLSASARHASPHTTHSLGLLASTR